MKLYICYYDSMSLSGEGYRSPPKVVFDDEIKAKEWCIQRPESADYETLILNKNYEDDE